MLFFNTLKDAFSIVFWPSLFIIKHVHIVLDLFLSLNFPFFLAALRVIIYGLSFQQFDCYIPWGRVVFMFILFIVH